MFTHSLKNLPKKTYEVTVKIPKEEIKKEYDLAFDDLHKDFETEGFRKGKVPRDIAVQKMNREAVYQKLIRSLLPKIYGEILEKEKLQPVISPVIDLANAKDGEDWEVVIKTAEKPEIDLSKYKEIVKKAKADSKKADIWVPGKDTTAPEQKPEAQSQQALNEVLSALLKEVKVEISDLIIEQELERKLAKLVDDVQRLGLSIDTYLKSKNMTMEQLRQQFTQEIDETYRLEFLLNDIADLEKIQVEDADMDKLFGNLKTEEEKQQARQNAYFYATLMRKQKTLDYILGL